MLTATTRPYTRCRSAWRLSPRRTKTSAVSAGRVAVRIRNHTALTSGPATPPAFGPLRRSQVSSIKMEIAPAFWSHLPAEPSVYGGVCSQDDARDIDSNLGTGRTPACACSDDGAGRPERGVLDRVEWRRGGTATALHQHLQRQAMPTRPAHAPTGHNFRPRCRRSRRQLRSFRTTCRTTIAPLASPHLALCCVGRVIIVQCGAPRSTELLTS